MISPGHLAIVKVVF